MIIQKRRSKIRRLLVATILACVVLGCVGVAFYVTRVVSEKKEIRGANVTQPVAPSPSSDNTAPALASVSEIPSRLIIKKIKVDAVIQPVGLTEAGAMDAPKALDEVGWYDKSALAGHGDLAMLLDGHFGIDPQPGVFRRLSELLVGDMIIVEGKKGARLSYKIVETATHSLEDVDMRKALYPYREGVQSLTIITCEGTYEQARATYSKRSIVYAERVS